MECIILYTHGYRIQIWACMYKETRAHIFGPMDSSQPLTESCAVRTLWTLGLQCLHETLSGSSRWRPWNVCLFWQSGFIRTITDTYIQVVRGRAGGGSFRREKNYIAKKEFSYRMCARRPTSAMPKPFLCCEWTSLLLFHGGDATCFDVMKLLARWDEVMWLVVRWRGVSCCG